MTDPTPRFRDLEPAARLDWLAQRGLLPADDTLVPLLESGGLPVARADELIENAIGVMGMPVGVALGLVVNRRERLVAMVIEEPSVVAAQNHVARFVASSGGFECEVAAPVMIGQVQLLDAPDPAAAVAAIHGARDMLLAAGRGTNPTVESLGGGLTGIEARAVSHPDGEVFVVVHLLVDVRDAMGANMINTLAEVLAPRLAELAGARIGLRIVTNLADRRLVRARCRIPRQRLPWHGFTGDEVAGGVVAASRFAEADPYRAATHNKGIMNGIDALLLATGNDWRAVEAAAHAWAARGGRYEPLSRFWCDDAGALCGELELPMPVGVVGGATRHHPLAAALLRLMAIESAADLSCLAAAVGLAQNLAALKALGTEGIQKGHMRLHARRLP